MKIISQDVRKKLNEVSKISVSTPEGNVNLVDGLRKMPRGGKQLCFREHAIDLPFRSVWDHTITLGESADTFCKALSFSGDRGKLARFIAFHDLAEAIMGDVPCYAAPEMIHLIKSREEKDKKENEANELIVASLDGELKKEYCEYLAEMESDEESELKTFFHFLDRSDPIMSVWRYVHLFKKSIDIGAFLVAMRAFFDHANVITYAVDDDTKNMIIFLQDADNAREFFHRGFSVFDQLHASKINAEMMAALIGKNEMHVV